MNNRKQAFTLIELLVVITIIAILAGAAIPYVQQYTEEARYSKAKSDLDEIRNALIRYENDNSKPYTETSISNLVGPYLMKSLIDPWGGQYYVSNASSTCYSAGADGTVDTGDEVKQDFRPPLALSKAYWEDTSGDGKVSEDDSIILKFTRPFDSIAANFQKFDNYDTSSAWPTADADISAVVFSNNDMTAKLTMANTAPLALPLFAPGKDTIKIANLNAAKIEDLNDPAIPCRLGGDIPIKAR